MIIAPLIPDASVIEKVRRSVGNALIEGLSKGCVEFLERFKVRDMAAILDFDELGPRDLGTGALLLVHPVHAIVKQSISFSTVL